MKMIRTVLVTDAIFTSSSISPEDPAAAWAVGTTYAADAVATKAHRRWKSLSAGNIGHDPVTSPTFWVDTGPTNAWAMLDVSIGSVSTDTGEIEVVLHPGAIDSVVVLDTDAETITVSMTVDGDEVYNETKSTNAGGEAIIDAWTYFFEPIGTREGVEFLDLPAIDTGVVTVTLLGPSEDEDIYCGTLAVGRQLDLGTTESEPKLGITDFSKKERDDFGNVTFVERDFVKTMSVRTKVDTSEVSMLYKALAAVRARPVVWIGEEGIDALTTYGIFRDFDFVLKLSNISYLTMEIESLV